MFLKFYLKLLNFLSFCDVKIVVTLHCFFGPFFFFFFLFFSLFVMSKHSLAEKWEKIEDESSSDDKANDHYPVLPSHRNDTKCCYLKRKIFKLLSNPNWMSQINVKHTHTHTHETLVFKICRSQKYPI